MTNYYLLTMVLHWLLTYTPFQVEGDSMYPNLRDHQIFLIDKADFKKPGLNRGDIIVFRIEDGSWLNNNYFYVKRVIGLPGETVKINSRGVFVKSPSGDYQKLDEPYLNSHLFHYGDERFFIVPEGKYFVLGDNRDASKDSRYFTDPYISLDEIYGKYVFP